MPEFNISTGNSEFIEEEVQEENVTPAAVAADLTSPLASLRKRRAEIIEDLYLDIKVPRWENPEIYVRFKPLSTVKLGASLERRRKSKVDDWSLLANADMLVDSCLGVYAVVDGDLNNKLSLAPGDPKGVWTKFDPALAAALGVDAQRAVDVCQALYLTEGDLIDTANKLFTWSNVSGEQADEIF
jgi:hypothetical protein